MLLSLAGASRTLTASSVSVHYALGHPKHQTVTMAIQAFTLLPVVAVGVAQGGVIGAAWAYFLHSMLVFAPISNWILVRTTPIEVSDIWEPICRPVLAGVAMFATVKPISDAWAAPEFSIALPRLLAMVALGAAVYFLCVLLLWTISGRPEGTEALLLRRAATMIRRNKARRDR
jgi:hypothetical protein